MAENIYKRICFEIDNGVLGKEVHEYHGTCACSACQYRWKRLSQPSNTVTVTVRDFSKEEEAKTFLKGWKCKDGNQCLSTEYYTF